MSHSRAIYEFALSFQFPSDIQVASLLLTEQSSGLMIHYEPIQFPPLVCRELAARVERWGVKYPDPDWHIALALAFEADLGRWIARQNDEHCPPPKYHSFRFRPDSIAHSTNGAPAPVMETVLPGPRHRSSLNQRLGSRGPVVGERRGRCRISTDGAGKWATLRS